MAQKKRRIYDPQTKAKALSVAVSLKSVSDAAKKLKIPRSTLRTWVSQAKLKEKLTERRSALFDMTKAPDEVSLRKLGYCAAIAIAQRCAARLLAVHGTLSDKKMHDAVVQALELARNTALAGLPRTASEVKQAQTACYAVSSAAGVGQPVEEARAIQATIFASAAVGAAGKKTPKRLHTMAQQALALAEGSELEPIWEDFFWLLENKTTYDAPIEGAFFER